MNTTDFAYEEAERRIAGWHPGEALDLAIDGLDRIPASVAGLKELTELRLIRFVDGENRVEGAQKVADLAPLSGLTALQSLDCWNTQVADLAPLSGLTALQSLNCSRTQVADLAPLSGLTALQSLTCSGIQVADLAPLSGLTALQSLDCSRTQVADLAPLSGLTALQSLTCWNTQVADLAPLSGLTALQSLNCWGTQVSDLAPLSGLTALQSLDCSHTQVSDLAPLSGLTALQSLDCSNTQVSDLAPLSGLTALQSLDCSDTPVSDLAPLSGLTALQSLTCSNTQVADLAPLSGLTALQSLDCSRTQVADLAPLSGLTALQSLTCSNTQVADLAPLSGLTALQSLDCSRTQVADLAPLSGLTALQSLNCWGTQVSDLAPLSGLTALQSLNCSGIQVADLAPLSGLTALQSLTCSGIQVADLAPLSGLTALQSLTCSNTQVADLAPLSGLTALQSLTCRNTQVADLAPLAGLTALESLTCSGIQVADLAPLSGLTALQSLTCSGIQVADLAPLSGLTALQSLTCSNTQVADLAPLSGLTALQSLTCSGTQVADLAPLSGLTALQSLNCWGTQVSDLAPLSGLTALQSLDLDQCTVDRFPEGLFDLPNLEKLQAWGARLGDVPAEVLSQDYHDNCLPRLRAHLRDLEAGAVVLREAKLLVLGNGRVGKTWLVHRLVGEVFDERVKSTHGIIVRPFAFDHTRDDKPAQLWIWDFGGQDIYHSTHTLFMRSRGIYLLCWTPAQEDNDEHTVDGHTFRNHQLPYWLSQIRAFGGPEAPLVLAQTQVDRLQDKRPLTEVAQEKVDTFETHFELHHSATKPRGLDDLNEALGECFATLQKPKIGKVRAAVKDDLDARIMAGHERTMTLTDFAALCDEKGGVEDASLFLETLHNAGVVFHRPGFFGEDIILDQQWAIAAIYAVLDRQSQTYRSLKSVDGVFSRSLLGMLLWDDQFSLDEQDLLLSMMQSCRICFVHREGHGEAEAQYIAPDLLPAEAKPGWDGSGTDIIQTRHYAHLPGALIRSAISAVGSEAGTQGDYWHTGLRVYETRLGSEAVIVSETADDSSGTLRLSARDGAASEFLDALARIVAQEEDRLGLAPSEVTGAPTAPKEAQDPPSKLSYGQPAAEPNTDWFFSYATDSETNDPRRPVETFCNAVEEAKGITIRRDVQELTYRDEIEPFMDQLAAGQRIFIWLTDAYLKSPYCMYELHNIWVRCGRDPDEFEDRVVFLLGDAKIRTEVDQKGYRDYWSSEREAAFDRLKTAPEENVSKKVARICEFQQTLSRMLDFVATRIRFRDFEEMIKWSLNQ